MSSAFFCSDLHGRLDRYHKLLELTAAEKPRAVFIGGDITPHPFDSAWSGQTDQGPFIGAFLAKQFAELRRKMGQDYPRIFLILGNDDTHGCEADLARGTESGLWEYIHGRCVTWAGHTVYGYNCVPPTPFLLKDWERYDVSRYVDPGCISPEEGSRTDGLNPRELRYMTIKDELAELVGDNDLQQAIFLLHTPPHQTNLDRAALDGKMIDHVPLDPHVGSIAVRNLIEQRQPLLTLHGHIHESAARTGSWRQCLGRTQMFSAAHHGPELALVRFDTENLESATREHL